MNRLIPCIRADSRTINRLGFCGWEFPRRVVVGSHLGRVVFPDDTAQVNGWLASLSANYRAEFASAHSNGRVRIEPVLNPAVLTLVLISSDDAQRHGSAHFGVQTHRDGMFARRLDMSLR